jgi:hypothetical protein
VTCAAVRRPPTRFSVRGWPSAEATRGATPELVVQAIHELARAAGALGLVGR